MGAPAGNPLARWGGWIDEADEGREMLKAESLATGIDESLSAASIVALVDCD